MGQAVLRERNVTAVDGENSKEPIEHLIGVSIGSWFKFLYFTDADRK